MLFLYGELMVLLLVSFAVGAAVAGGVVTLLLRDAHVKPSTEAAAARADAIATLTVERGPS